MMAMDRLPATSLTRVYYPLNQGPGPGGICGLLGELGATSESVLIFHVMRKLLQERLTSLTRIV